jgi:hypothetical protein
MQAGAVFMNRSDPLVWCRGRDPVRLHATCARFVDSLRVCLLGLAGLCVGGNDSGMALHLRGWLTRPKKCELSPELLNRKTIYLYILFYFIFSRLPLNFLRRPLAKGLH